MTLAPRNSLPVRALILAAAGVLLGGLAVVLVFSPTADPLFGGPVAAGRPGGTLLRLLLALLSGGVLAAALAVALFRGPWRDLARTGQILQESALPADDSVDEPKVPGGFAEAAAQLAEAAHRGRDTRESFRRLEQSMIALGRRFERRTGDDLEPWPQRAEADPAEQALLRGLNGWIEAVRAGRDRTAGLLAEVEDHLVGVHEAIDDVARALAGLDAPGARDRLLELRAAAMRVERELTAVRRRMGGAPVERLTENDFIGPPGGGPAKQE